MIFKVTNLIVLLSAVTSIGVANAMICHHFFQCEHEEATRFHIPIHGAILNKAKIHNIVNYKMGLHSVLTDSCQYCDKKTKAAMGNCSRSPKFNCLHHENRFEKQLFTVIAAVKQAIFWCNTLLSKREQRK